MIDYALARVIADHAIAGLIGSCAAITSLVHDIVRGNKEFTFKALFSAWLVGFVVSSCVPGVFSYDAAYLYLAIIVCGVLSSPILTALKDRSSDIIDKYLGGLAGGKNEKK